MKVYMEMPRESNSPQGKRDFSFRQHSSAETLSHQSRLLIAEDNPELLEYYIQIFRNSNYQIDLVDNGLAGWKAFEKSPYSLIITDHNMPQMTGLEFLKKLRAAHYHIPVILVSGTTFLEESDIRNLAPCILLPKPFSIPILLEKIEIMSKISCV
jgi:DNA-binding response OmpR family regulator